MDQFDAPDLASVQVPKKPFPRHDGLRYDSRGDIIAEGHMLAGDGERYTLDTALDVPSSVIQVPPRPRSITATLVSPLDMVLKAHALDDSVHSEEDFASYTPYIYQPLHHDDSIRLIKVLLGPDGSPLICDLVEVQRTHTQYQALSYVWGPAVFTHRIYERTSRCYVAITESLFSALHSLRHRQTSPELEWQSVELSWLWVDALCIDQSNVNERSHQVKSMAAIFSEALKVVVWLGPQEFGSVLSTLKQISSNREAINKPRKPILELPNKNFDEQDHIDTLIGNDAGRKEEQLADTTQGLRATFKKCDIVEFGNFFATAWFTRAWVLQEFLLAKNIDIIMGKEASITFDTIVSALDDLKLHEHLLPRGPSLYARRNASDKASFVSFMYTNDFLQHFEIVHEMFQARRIRRAHPHELSARRLRHQPKIARPIRTLYQWCRMLVDRKCADERDKVYAALGLAHNDLGIIPNYSLSVADVLLDLTIRSLRTGDFSVLHDAGVPDPDTTQPSFVPSLRPESRQHCPEPLGGYNNLCYESHRAGRSRRSHTRPLGLACVRIRGVEVDDVFYLDNFTDAIEDLTIGRGSPFKPQLLAAYDRATSAIKPYYSQTDFPSDHFKMAFWHTLNLGFVPRRADLPYYEKGVDFRFLDLPYRQNIAACMKHRVFFMTKNGFMGLAPSWAQKGDKIVIFDGAETPFLLRRATTDSDDEVWTFIGDCYLQGWMIGDYLGCTILSESTSNETAEENTYPKGVMYEDSEFRKSPLWVKFFTLC